MQRGAKIALASGIVLSGLIVAAMFRKSPQPSTTPREPWPAPFDGPLAPIVSEQPATEARLLGKIDPVRPVEASVAVSTAAAHADPFAEPHPPSSARKRVTSAPAGNSAALSDEQDSGEPRQRNSSLHRVRDGDTLSSLARQYLGSSKRYLEIYEANRDILSSPDLLPIGAGLKIPPADAVVRLAAPAGQIDPPLAQLSPRPVVRPEPRAGNRRTYRVKTGDTLATIAQRFYGDGERYAEIYEANRQRLKAPADLREGLLLDIP